MQSELSVVNALLQVIGESPINEVDRSDPNVLAALVIWEKNSSAEQSISYWYNTETWELTVTTEGYVYLPSDTLSIIADPTYVKRGRRLYNLETHSYDFSDVETVDVDIITAWSVDELPPVMYNYLVELCKADMVATYAMDQVLLSKILGDVKQAYHKLQVQNMRAQGPNATAVGSARTLLQNKPQRG